jgi:hypothetical protein
VNPWTTGSRFIVSHRLLTDEVYVAGLRDVLGEFRARALFERILDLANHQRSDALWKTAPIRGKRRRPEDWEFISFFNLSDEFGACTITSFMTAPLLS